VEFCRAGFLRVAVQPELRGRKFDRRPIPVDTAAIQPEAPISTLAEISQQITDAIEQRRALEVRTVINDAEHGNRTLLTQIDMLTGDIEARMHLDCVTGELAGRSADRAPPVQGPSDGGCGTALMRRST
jgi:hypothetical protein